MQQIGFVKWLRSNTDLLTNPYRCTNCMGIGKIERLTMSGLTLVECPCCDGENKVKDLEAIYQQKLKKESALLNKLARPNPGFQLTGEPRPGN